MTPDQIEAERTKFEARYSKDGCNFRRVEDGEYISGPTWCLFRGWLARAEEQYASEAAAEEEVERLGRYWPTGERAE